MARTTGTEASINTADSRYGIRHELTDMTSPATGTPTKKAPDQASSPIPLTRPRRSKLTSSPIQAPNATS